MDPTKEIITTCRTGVMAAALETALNKANFGPRGERRVYDGSWTLVLLSGV